MSAQRVRKPSLIRVLMRSPFIRDDRGQDLVEYALLTALFGLAALAAAPAIRTALGVAYSAWNTSGQNLWVPPDPAGGS
jgi:Flp pilus assembly pilin Flp